MAAAQPFAIYPTLAGRTVLVTGGDAGRAELKRNQCIDSPLLPEHVARMALFLASDDSAMCTAQDFVVDGGWT